MQVDVLHLVINLDENQGSASKCSFKFFLLVACQVLSKTPVLKIHCYRLLGCIRFRYFYLKLVNLHELYWPKLDLDSTKI